MADDIEMCVPSKDVTILDMCGGTGAVAIKVDEKHPYGAEKTNMFLSHPVKDLKTRY